MIVKGRALPPEMEWIMAALINIRNGADPDTIRNGFHTSPSLIRDVSRPVMTRFDTTIRGRKFFHNPGSSFTLG